MSGKNKKSASEKKEEDEPDVIVLTSKTYPNRNYYYDKKKKISYWQHPYKGPPARSRESSHSALKTKAMTVATKKPGNSTTTNNSASTDSSKPVQPAKNVESKPSQDSKARIPTSEPAKSKGTPEADSSVSEKFLHSVKKKKKKKSKKKKNKETDAKVFESALQETVKKPQDQDRTSVATKPSVNFHKYKIPKVKQEEVRRDQPKKKCEIVEITLDDDDDDEDDDGGCGRTVANSEKNSISSNSNIIQSPNHECFDEPQSKKGRHIPQVTLGDEIGGGKSENSFLTNDSSIIQINTDSFHEEMDWEPCDEELDADIINSACMEMNTVNKISNEVFSDLNRQDSSTLMQLESSSVVLVLDTNIFVSCLNFVKDIMESNVPKLGYPILYIPWCVLQELDHLKNYKESQIQRNARKAIMYLNNYFKVRHPRFYGQSYQDFVNAVDVNTSVADDQILQTCISLLTSCRDKKVILVTNDKNLESKAIVSNVEAYSKERFQSQYLSSIEGGVAKGFGGGPGTSNDGRPGKSKKGDDIVCRLKEILKEFLTPILESEMKSAFDKHWQKVCFKKPPWTLRDILQCWKKHWIAVFSFAFNKPVLSDVEELHQKLFQSTSGRDKRFTGDLVELSQNLIRGVRNSRGKNSYVAAADGALNKVSNLLNGTSQTQQVDPVQPVQPVQSVDDENFNFAKDMFRYIWDSLKEICGAAMEIMSSPAVCQSMNVPETRLKLLQRHSEIVKLVSLVETTLDVHVGDIRESHSAICDLCEFLVRYLPFMEPGHQVKLPKCLATFFTNSEGRALLLRSLHDFREFSQSLSKANEFIERVSSGT